MRCWEEAARDSNAAATLIPLVSGRENAPKDGGQEKSSSIGTRAWSGDSGESGLKPAVSRMWRSISDPWRWNRRAEEARTESFDDDALETCAFRILLNRYDGETTMRTV